MHPSTRDYYEAYTVFDNISLLGDEVSYRQIFAESKLMITDYSSTSMDFAYMGKAVVYCQFDKDEFYNRHIHAPGYFDYEKDGFGPVTKNYLIL